MLEELMLRREQFPLTLLDYYGNPFDNMHIIPPFHKDIVEQGINLTRALSVIDEAVRETLADLSGDTHGIPSSISYPPATINQDSIVFGNFPFVRGFCIQKEKISPYGGDCYIRIDKDSSSAGYWILPEHAFSPELLKEYDVSEPLKHMRYLIYYCNTGWRSHNVDSRDVFYKNFIIALNNATVREKYST